MGYFRNKPRDQRFNDTYTFIEGLALPGVEAGVTLMDLRKRALEAAGQSGQLSDALSLGTRWEISKSADETRRRHYIRAVLLGYATLGDPAQQGKLLSVAEVKAKKNATTSLKEADLRQILTRMVGQSVQTEGQRTFVGLNTSLEKQNSVWALDKIAEGVTRTQMALGLIPRDARENTRFQTWFGTSDKRAIHANFGKILAGIRGGIMLIKDPDPAEDDTFGYVYKSGPRNPPRVYLCNAFWRSGRLTWQQRGGALVKKDGRKVSDNPLGVILHELSHLFAHTVDTEYGRDDCKRLARSNPGAAAANADNHEYYAESVMTGHYD